MSTVWSKARLKRLLKDAFIGSASNHNTITPSSRDTENVLVYKYKLIHLEQATGSARPTINGSVYLTNLSPGGFNRMDSSDYGHDDRVTLWVAPALLTVLKSSVVCNINARFLTVLDIYLQRDVHLTLLRNVWSQSHLIKSDNVG